MKFIHTADILLDRCYADLDLPPNVGRENRAHLRAQVGLILDQVLESQADALLISGNLLALDRVERETVAFLREAFARIAPIPVVITPGPHDPCTATSPYATELWPENVHLFASPEWTSVSVAGIPIYGFGYDRPTLKSNPFENFEAPATNSPFIVMGAGTIRSLVKDDATTECIIEPSLFALPGLAYMALGGAVHTLHAGEAEGIDAWYAGAPDRVDFGDTGPHDILLVHLPAASSEAQTKSLRAEVTPISLTTGRFFEMAIDCTDLPSGQALLDEIRPRLAVEPDCQCARIILEGALLPEIYDEMASIGEALAEDVLFLDLVDRCFVAENFEALATQKTSLGAFVARINTEIDDAPDAERHAALCRSRDLALCAYRGQHLPIRTAHGD